MGTFEVAKVSDIPNGQMKPITLEGKELLVFNLNGKYYAMPRRCTHLNGDLSQGKFEGNTIQCPRHHAKFDITTGECVSRPRIGPLKLSAKNEPIYEVVIEGDSIKVRG
jgi:3-phenylpropionate/trans-cinnamate dioxygenase ferredoxin component